MDQGTHQGLELRTLRTLAMTTQLRQAIGMLKHSNADLRAYLARLAQANPAVALAPQQAPPDGGEPRPGGGLTPRGGGNGGAESMLAQPAAGLHAHVMAQIGMEFRDPADRAVAEAFAAALEPSGWLGATPADIARTAGCGRARAERILSRLQGIEPAGLFARDLAECLRLQAHDRGLLTPEMDTVLGHLDLLARGALDALARLAGTTETRIEELARQLRGFDPKPGAAFGAAPAPIRPPDLIVTPRGIGRWQVDLNHATTPQVTVREPDADTLPDAQERARAVAEARWLERAVARRNATTLKIAAAVVRHQAEFLRRGPEALRPLTHADIAAETDMHESTISRVAAGMMVATPRGTLAMRDFFCTRLRGGEGDSASTVAAHHAVARIVAGEDPAAPKSDAAIAREMDEQGIRIARRTVTKYRVALGIGPVSARRKRVAGKAGG